LNWWYFIPAILLLITILAGLIRVARGPTSADRMLAAQLFGTTGVAILMLLSKAWNEPPLQDVAGVFALLAAVIGVSFVRRGWRMDQVEE
jgi:multicomponent Na+:H+ antiporter subunit F